MNYIQLGASDLKISEIGFGCMSLGANEREGISIIEKAFEKGINYFDTADIYENGANETLVGKALRAIRNKVIIASKVGNVRRKYARGLDWDAGKNHVLSSIDESLQRLQTDYLDLYQLHGGTMEDPIDETIEAFELLKQQGKIRYYGISSIRPDVIREYVKRSSITSVMMQYSLLDRRPGEECLDLLHQHNIGVLARGSLAQGLLVDKPAKSYLDRSEEDVREAARTVASLSGTKRTNAQTAIRYALCHRAVTAAIVGIRTMEQLNEAAGIDATPPLCEDDIKLLSSNLNENFYKEHR